MSKEGQEQTNIFVSVRHLHVKCAKSDN